ncbi:hypothetical protein [Pseudoclavibacter soli]|uniref:variant leucine-rich repeat-containing protein n=1 Tax=Pseudoclavibacter soli TaxID=452623 RepID=UPI0004119197|nr:hypothetical protein [Pseudoclavibacter soli]
MSESQWRPNAADAGATPDLAEETTVINDVPESITQLNQAFEATTMINSGQDAASTTIINSTSDAVTAINGADGVDTVSAGSAGSTDDETVVVRVTQHTVPAQPAASQVPAAAVPAPPVSALAPAAEVDPTTAAAAALAANPAATPEQLRWVAQYFPQFHAQLAANPTLDQPLRDWLTAQGVAPALPQLPVIGQVPQQPHRVPLASVGTVGAVHPSVVAAQSAPRKRPWLAIVVATLVALAAGFVLPLAAFAIIAQLNGR